MEKNNLYKFNEIAINPDLITNQTKLMHCGVYEHDKFECELGMYDFVNSLDGFQFDDAIGDNDLYRTIKRGIELNKKYGRKFETIGDFNPESNGGFAFYQDFFGSDSRELKKIHEKLTSKDGYFLKNDVRSIEKMFGLYNRSKIGRSLSYVDFGVDSEDGLFYPRGYRDEPLKLTVALKDWSAKSLEKHSAIVNYMEAEKIGKIREKLGTSSNILFGLGIGLSMIPNPLTIGLGTALNSLGGALFAVDMFLSPVQREKAGVSSLDNLLATSLEFGSLVIGGKLIQKGLQTGLDRQILGGVSAIYGGAQGANYLAYGEFSEPDLRNAAFIGGAIGLISGFRYYNNVNGGSGFGANVRPQNHTEEILGIELNNFSKDSFEGSLTESQQVKNIVSLLNSVDGVREFDRYVNSLDSEIINKLIVSNILDGSGIPSPSVISDYIKENISVEQLNSLNKSWNNVNEEEFKKFREESKSSSDGDGFKNKIFSRVNGLYNEANKNIGLSKPMRIADSKVDDMVRNDLMKFQRVIKSKDVKMMASEYVKIIRTYFNTYGRKLNDDILPNPSISRDNLISMLVDPRYVNDKDRSLIGTDSYRMLVEFANNYNRFIGQENIKVKVGLKDWNLFIREFLDGKRVKSDGTVEDLIKNWGISADNEKVLFSFNGNPQDLVGFYNLDKKYNLFGSGTYDFSSWLHRDLEKRANEFYKNKIYFNQDFDREELLDNILKKNDVISSKKGKKVKSLLRRNYIKTGILNKYILQELKNTEYLKNHPKIKWFNNEVREKIRENPVDAVLLDALEKFIETTLAESTQLLDNLYFQRYFGFDDAFKDMNLADIGDLTLDDIEINSNKLNSLDRAVEHIGRGYGADVAKYIRDWLDADNVDGVNPHLLEYERLANLIGSLVRAVILTPSGFKSLMKGMVDGGSNVLKMYGKNKHYAKFAMFLWENINFLDYSFLYNKKNIYGSSIEKIMSGVENYVIRPIDVVNDIVFNFGDMIARKTGLHRFFASLANGEIDDILKAPSISQRVSIAKAKDVLNKFNDFLKTEPTNEDVLAYLKNNIDAHTVLVDYVRNFNFSSNVYGKVGDHLIGRNASKFTKKLLRILLPFQQFTFSALGATGKAMGYDEELRSEGIEPDFTGSLFGYLLPFIFAGILEEIFRNLLKDDDDKTKMSSERMVSPEGFGEMFANEMENTLYTVSGAKQVSFMMFRPRGLVSSFYDGLKRAWNKIDDDESGVGEKFLAGASAFYRPLQSVGVVLGVNEKARKKRRKEVNEKRDNEIKKIMKQEKVKRAEAEKIYVQRNLD